LKPSDRRRSASTAVPRDARPWAATLLSGWGGEGRARDAQRKGQAPAEADHLVTKASSARCPVCRKEYLRSPAGRAGPPNSVVKTPPSNLVNNRL
jgi:hypothetical protein